MRWLALRDSEEIFNVRTEAVTNSKSIEDCKLGSSLLAQFNRWKQVLTSILRLLSSKIGNRKNPQVFLVGLEGFGNNRLLKIRRLTADCYPVVSDPGWAEYLL